MSRAPLCGITRFGRIANLPGKKHLANTAAMMNRPSKQKFDPESALGNYTASAPSLFSRRKGHSSNGSAPCTIIHTMNVSGIDLNLPAVFEAMIDERSVTRAAARVGLSQPAMSNALARLRLAFGDPLFVRTSQGMMPSRRAREIAVSAQAALDLIRGTLACSNFDAARSQAYISHQLYRLCGSYLCKQTRSSA